MDWIDLSYYGLVLSMVEVEQAGKLIPSRMVMALQNDTSKPGAAEAARLLSLSDFTRNARRENLWALPEDEFRLTRLFRTFPQALEREVSADVILRRIKAKPPAPIGDLTAPVAPHFQAQVSPLIVTSTSNRPSSPTASGGAVETPDKIIPEVEGSTSPKEEVAVVLGQPSPVLLDNAKNPPALPLQTDGVGVPSVAEQPHAAELEELPIAMPALPIEAQAAQPSPTGEPAANEAVVSQVPITQSLGGGLFDSRPQSILSGPAYEISTRDRKPPANAAVIYAWDEKRETPAGIERTRFELSEAESGQRFITERLGRSQIYYTTENPDLASSRRSTLFMRLTRDDANLDALVSLYVRQALTYEVTMRGSDLERFTKIIFGKERYAEGLSKVNEAVQRMVVDSIMNSTTQNAKPKSLLEIYNSVAELSRLFVHGSALQATQGSPSLVAKVALQRVAVTGKTDKNQRIYFYGDSTMAFAMPDARRITEIVTDNDAPITSNSVLDLSGNTVLGAPIEVDGFQASNSQEVQLLKLLDKRAADGRTQVLLARGANEEPFIKHIACRYAIEGRAIIDPVLADGDANAPQFYMLLVGKRRPAVLDEPHEAAMRVKNIEDWPSLWSWTSTVVANRSKIDKYYEAAGVISQDGTENQSAATKNYFQVPYTSLSRVAEPTAMVPRNMADSIRHSLARVRKDIPDVDAWLSSRLGVTGEALGKILGPEQIDAIAMMQHAWGRGYAFLLGDQTGIGKGRTLMASVATLLNPDPSIEKLKSAAGNEITKILVLTENTTNISDLFRDIYGLGKQDWFKPAFVNGELEIRDEITEELLSPGTPTEDVKAWVDAKVWPEGVNVVFGTYSQFNKSTSTKRRQYQMTEAELKRAAKAFWLDAVVDKNTLVIADEAQNALGLSSSTGVNTRAALEKAGLVAWSSGTHGKDSRSAHLYLRAMPKDVDKQTLMEVLQKGGESIAEVFTAMLSREGTIIRREHDLSRCDYTTFEISEQRQIENRVHMDAMAAILSEIAFVNGDVQERVNSMNMEIATQLIADDPMFGVNPEAVQDQFKSLQMKRQSFGSPLYNLSRIFVAALIVDDTVDKAVAKLKEGRKPVLLVENTVENILRGLIDPTNKEPQTVPEPDFSMVIRRMIKTMLGWSDAKGNKQAVLEVDPVATSNFVGFRIREVNHRISEELDSIFAKPEGEAGDDWSKLVTDAYGQEIERLTSIGYLSEEAKASAMRFVGDIATAPAPRNNIDFAALVDTIFPIGGAENAVALAAALSRIEIMIDALPPLRASFIDSLRDGIEAAGFTCDEITGRSLMYKEGQVMLRQKRSRTDIKNAFNRGDLDALIINKRGAAGIDLHAGEKFKDQRPRTMFPVQTPADPLTLLQALGRIFRNKQTSRPEVIMPMTGLPIHARFIMMTNAKLGKVSATTTSNREHSAKINTVPDLFSTIGDIVCANYFNQRPDLLLRMGFPAKQDDDVDDENAITVAAAQAADMVAFGEESDEKRKANTLIGRMIMLTDAEQRAIWDDICAEYEAHIQELDAKGTNPLKSQTIEGKVHLKGMTPLSGDYREIDQSNEKTFVSEFMKPVFLQDITIERQVRPVRADDLEIMVANGLTRYEMEQVGGVVERLNRRRDENMSIWNGTNLPLEMALDQLAEAGVENVLTKHVKAYDKLRFAMAEILPGKKVHFSLDGIPAFGVVVQIKAPDTFYSSTKNYTLASHWDVMVQIPGTAQPFRFTASALLNDENFSVEPGLESAARAEVLEAFEDSVNASRLEAAQILTGNLWEAMRLNIKMKLGKLTSWVDDTGIVHRGVLISKKNMGASELMSRLPTPVVSAESAHSILCEKKIKIYGSNDLDTNGLTIYREGSQKWILSLPYASDRSFTDFWEDQALLKRLVEISTEDNDKPGRGNLAAWLDGTRDRPSNKLTLLLNDSKTLLSACELLSGAGVKFFASSKAREHLKAKTIAAVEAPHADEDLIERQVEAQLDEPEQEPAVRAPRRVQRRVQRAAAVVEGPPEVVDPPPAPEVRRAPALAAGAGGENLFGFRIIPQQAGG